MSASVVPVKVSRAAVPLMVLMVLLTVSLKISLTLAPELSLAVILTSIAPTLLLPGVPLKVRVVALKVSQLGKGFPLLRVAV